MPMWRVQTKSYEEAEMMIGLVCRTRGFADSPDTEWISAGENSKGPDGMALGRHGNFFHWGFAACPEDMTEEAKVVFINAIHYIAHFDGQSIIAPLQQDATVRGSLDARIHQISDTGWAEMLAGWERGVEALEKRQAAVQARIDAGEEVLEHERAVLNYGELGKPERFAPAYLFYPREEWDALPEKDPAEVIAYLRENGPFFHSQDYSLIIDEELKAFGVGNNAPDFLEKAVAALNTPEQAELALKLLKRYTLEEFESPAEWNHWLEQNRQNFFFSETAGYKWMVNK